MVELTFEGNSNSSLENAGSGGAAYDPRLVGGAYVAEASGLHGSAALRFNTANASSALWLDSPGFALSGDWTLTAWVNGPQDSATFRRVLFSDFDEVPDEQLTPAWLLEHALPLLADPVRLDEMGAAAAAFGRRDGDEALADLVYEAAGSAGKPAEAQGEQAR